MKSTVKTVRTVKTCVNGRWVLKGVDTSIPAGADCAQTLDDIFTSALGAKDLRRDVSASRSHENRYFNY